MKTLFDKKIFRFLGAVVNVVWLSILWYLSCILVFTVGAASSSMYYTVHTHIFNGRGYLFSTYKEAFLNNFKKASVIWLICLFTDAFLFFDLTLTRMAIDQGSILAMFYYPVLVCIVLAVMWQLSLMAYQARFDDTIKGVLLKGAWIASRNIGWMLFLVAFLAGAVLLCRYLIMLVVVLPAGYTCLMHHVFEHIFKKVGWLREEDSSRS